MVGSPTWNERLACGAVSRGPMLSFPGSQPSSKVVEIQHVHLAVCRSQIQTGLQCQWKYCTPTLQAWLSHGFGAGCCEWTCSTIYNSVTLAVQGAVSPYAPLHASGRQALSRCHGFAVPIMPPMHIILW